MTTPSDHAASAAQTIDWGAWVKCAAGASVTMSQINDWVTLAVGLLTIVYTVLKIFEWIKSTSRHEREQRTLERVWDRLDKMSSRPIPLDDQSHHRSK
jgi:hypothetical protein